MLDNSSKYLKAIVKGNYQKSLLIRNSICAALLSLEQG